jgi:hypothetical protein
LPAGKPAAFRRGEVLQEGFAEVYSLATGMMCKRPPYVPTRKHLDRREQRSASSYVFAVHALHCALRGEQVSLMRGDAWKEEERHLGLVWFMPLIYPTKILVTWKAPSLVWFTPNFLAANRLFSVDFTKRCQLFDHP